MKTQWTNPAEPREISRREIQDMRDWLSDCEWANADFEAFQDMSAPVIARGVSRHFAGGVITFLGVL